MSNVRKLLLVTYVFPPAGGITVQRALSLARYLPRSGYEVHVLTARNAAAPVRDAGLLDRVPAEVTVHRALTPELPFYIRKKLWDRLSPAPATPVGKSSPGRRRSTLGAAIQKLLCPDPQVVWVPFAVRRASQIIEKHGIDIVLVTAPPFSAFLIGNALKRRFPHVKLISDFRDEWLRFYLTDFDFLTSEHTRLRAEAIERATVELSDLVIAVTRSSLVEIRGRYPKQPDDKFVLLPNGYDQEVFARFTPRRHGKEKVVVTHLGTAYKTSSPKYYLDGLDSLPERIRSQFETRLVGRISETERAAVEFCRSAVRITGFLPQEQALREAEETDYLLLTMTNDFSLPGKLFEYLAMAKPILALSPPGGEVDRILKETRAGWCVDPNDPRAIRGMLFRAFEKARNGGASLQVDLPSVRRYERERLTEQLDGFIRKLFPASAPSTG